MAITLMGSTPFESITVAQDALRSWKRISGRLHFLRNAFKVIACDPVSQSLSLGKMNSSVELSLSSIISGTRLGAISTTLSSPDLVSL